MAIAENERDLVVWTLARTPRGRAKLIASLNNPMRLRLSFDSMAAKCMAEGIGVEDALVFEHTERVLWEAFRNRRYHALDKIQTKLVAEFKTVLDDRLFALCREASPPRTEEFPEGWNKALMNVRTLMELGKQELLDPMPPDQIGGSATFRKARVICSKAVEPGLVYAFGDPETVGLYSYDIELTDASEANFDGALHLKNIGFTGTLTHRMELKPDAKVAVYVHG